MEQQAVLKEKMHLGKQSCLARSRGIFLLCTNMDINNNNKKKNFQMHILTFLQEKRNLHIMALLHEQKHLVKMCLGVTA